MSKNPYNIGVLLRWQKWGVYTTTEKPDALTEEEYQEFLKDWEKAIDDSIKATSTEEVAKIGKALYEKWEKVFGETAPENTCTGIEESKESFGEGKLKEEESGEPPLGKDPTEIEENPDLFMSRPLFEWDEEWIRRTIAELRRYLKLPSYTDTEYRMTGRRINPVRAENLLPPFRRKETISYSIKDHRLLIVIDGSGSMRERPYYWASHTARVLSEFFRVDIVITTTQSYEPIQIRNVDMLRYYPAFGAENYRSLEDLPTKYDFTLFLTDACVDQLDWEYAGNLSRTCKVGAGYVHPNMKTNVEDALRKVFERYFYARPDRVAVEVGLYLKRLLLRRA